MIKFTIKTVPVILMTALLSGCASEFMKATPAYTGKLVYGISKSGEHVRWNDPKAEKIEEADMSKNLNRLDADRVNVWPLVYYNFPVTSIFWPCAEINDKGWAARPFIMADDYNKDYYYMMWLGNVDYKNQSSYFIPAYYKSKDSFVSLPCFWNKKTLGIMPPLFIVGDRDEAPAYNFMFPFAQYIPSEKSSYVFPLYLKSDDLFLSMLAVWSDRSMAVVPPLFAMTNRNKKPTYHIMFPLGKYNTATGTNYALPLYYKSDDLFLSMLGGWSDSNMAIVPPLFIMTDRDEKPKYHIMWPLGKYSSETGTNYALPLYYSDNESFYTMLTGWEKEKFFYVCGPLFWVNTERENIYNVMWPLVRTCPAKSEYRFQPLFDYEPSKSGYDLMYLLFFGNVWKKSLSSGSFFFPLYKYKTDANSNLDTLLTPLFGIYNGCRDFYVVPPLYIRDHQKETDPKYRNSAFNTEDDIGYTDHNIFFPFGKLRVIDKPTEKIPKYQGHAFMFYGHYEDDLDNTRWLMWPFYYHCEDYSLRDMRTPEEWKDKNSKPKIKKEFKDETVASFPFYYHKRKPDSSYSNFFGFAGNIHEDIAGTARDSYYAFPFYLDLWTEITEDLESNMSMGRFGKSTPSWKSSSSHLRYYFPFVAATEYPEKNESGLIVLPFFYFYNRTPEEISHSSFFWFFARYEDLKNKSVLSEAMWFLFYYKDQQKTATEEAFTSFRVFGKLYHREKTDDGVNVDVFPFIKYSERNKNKNEHGFSFAWRFFNIKNDDDGLKRLDMFFIPFYSKGKNKDDK